MTTIPPPSVVAQAYAGARAPIPGQWTFWAETVVSRTPLGPLAPSGFRATSKLSGFGSGEITLPVASSTLSAEQLRRLWYWKVWAIRAGRVIWAGIPTGVTDEGRSEVSLTLTELTGYLEKRVYDTHHRYNQVEQTAIAADLAAPLTDIGVAIVTSPGPGFPRDREYELLESGSRANLLVNLSNVISGPQFRAEYGMTPAGRPQCTLKIAYPRAGTDTGLGVTIPGGHGYSASWDADQLRTRTYAVGELPEDAPEGTPRPVVMEDRPQDGLPRLDVADDWPGVILESTLRERAITNATLYAAPVLSLSASASEQAPPLGSYAVGDTVTVNVTTPFLAGGLTVAGQLTEMTADAGTGAVAWTVATALPPPRPRETIAGWLARLEAVSSATFRRRVQLLGGP